MAKIDFRCQPCVPLATTERNIAETKRRGIPGFTPPASPKLAVLGGGHSVKDFPRSWDGEIWAINRTWDWLGNPDAWFYSVDPQPELAPMAKGVKRAILATCCDPAVFDAVEYAEAFDIGPDGIENGPTSAATAPMAALVKGYRQVVFWGCESSYQRDTSHIYLDEEVPDLMRVKVAGREYLTKPGLLLQAQVLASVIRHAPHVFYDRSGGLLSALIESPDFDVISISPFIEKSLSWEAVHHGNA